MPINNNNILYIIRYVKYCCTIGDFSELLNRLSQNVVGLYDQTRGLARAGSNAIAVFRDQRIQQVPVEIQCHGLPSRNPMNWIIYPLFLWISIHYYPLAWWFIPNVMYEWIIFGSESPSVSIYDTARAEVPILQGALHRRERATKTNLSRFWVFGSEWHSVWHKIAMGSLTKLKF